MTSIITSRPLRRQTTSSTFHHESNIHYSIISTDSWLHLPMGSLSPSSQLSLLSNPPPTLLPHPARRPVISSSPASQPSISQPGCSSSPPAMGPQAPHAQTSKYRLFWDPCVSDQDSCPTHPLFLASLLACPPSSLSALPACLPACLKICLPYSLSALPAYHLWVVR